MTHEAEKVITMSLSKMAESRGLRRGGTSLHKHLLISSVLTKARSAYFDNWCTIESNGSEISSALPRPSGAPQLIPVEPISDADETALLDSRSLFQLDSAEMDLPRDILNCVEKMGEISNEVGFNLETTVSHVNEESNEDRPSNAELILADFVDELEESEDSPAAKSFTYLDLDQNSAEVLVNSLSTTDGVTSQPFSTAITPPTFSPSKRRRDWNFDLNEEEDSSKQDSIGTQFLGQTKRFRFSINESYTFRGSCDSKENTIPAGTSMLMSISTTNYNSSGNRTPLEPFFTFKGNNFSFRTKKAQFEEVEEETEDSPFLLEDEDCDEYGPMMEKKGKNDRRVPSSSNGSCSSSDEEHEQETAMEVDLDKITNLVQYISFNKGSGGGSGLVRSISTPDLFSCSGKGSEAVASTSSTQGKTKDLYSTFNSHAHYHQRIVTMKV